MSDHEQIKVIYITMVPTGHITFLIDGNIGGGGSVVENGTLLAFFLSFFGDFRLVLTSSSSEFDELSDSRRWD